MTTYVNDSFFLLLLAFNVSVISLFLIGRVRKLQTEVSQLRSTIFVAREQSARSAHGLSGRIQALEGQMITANAQKAELKANKPMETNLAQANKLLDLGIDSEQLVKGFGLSEAEANLMSLVHTKQEQVSAAA